ncbi:MAG TPA: caspase family protein [Stenomitos sp.]
MTERTQETENLKRAMILEAVESEPVKQGRSLVVTIGINEYVHWQKLKNAVQDAIGFQQVLIDKLGFNAPIPPLIDSNATKAAITSLVEDQIRDVLQDNDNLVLFFAGHGHTRVDTICDKVCGETGFLVPVEARGLKEYWGDFIEIDSFLKAVSRLPVRHILVILDSCHSGFALGEAMKSFRDAVRYEKDVSSRISRKVITSARREQPALDGGPVPGHSLFTGTLIDGFNWGKADLDGNGLITSSELGLFIQQKVGQASESKQTPDFGSFYWDDRGEMVISLRNQTFDALKARAFSALQRGDFPTFKELVEQLIILKPSSPESLYLEYRLVILEGNFERAVLIINELSQLHLLEGIIPFSKNALWELENILPYWMPVLKINEAESSIDVTVFSGKSVASLELVHEQAIGEMQGYSIKNNALLQICLKNTTESPVYVYAIQITASGYIDAIILLKPEVMLKGLIPGKTELSHPFIPGKETGIGEIRLFSSPQMIGEFMFHPKPGAKGFIQAFYANELKQMKVKLITYFVEESF